MSRKREDRPHHPCGLFRVVVPKTGLEPVSLSAADFKSDVYTVPPLGPTAPKCGRALDWQPGKAGQDSPSPCPRDQTRLPSAHANALLALRSAMSRRLAIHSGKLASMTSVPRMNHGQVSRRSKLSTSCPALLGATHRLPSPNLVLLLSIKPKP